MQILGIYVFRFPSKSVCHVNLCRLLCALVDYCGLLWVATSGSLWALDASTCLTNHFKVARNSVRCYIRFGRLRLAWNLSRPKLDRFCMIFGHDILWFEIWRQKWSKCVRIVSKLWEIINYILIELNILWHQLVSNPITRVQMSPRIIASHRGSPASIRDVHILKKVNTSCISLRLGPSNDTRSMYIHIVSVLVRGATHAQKPHLPTQSSWFLVHFDSLWANIVLWHSKLHWTYLEILLKIHENVILDWNILQPQQASIHVESVNKQPRSPAVGSRWVLGVGTCLINH